MSIKRQPIDEDRQVEVYMSYYEEALRAARDGYGVYSTVDHMLDNAKPEEMTPSAILAVLSITWHGKSFLTRRDAFFERAEPIFRAKIGDDTRADKLLENRR
jgi:hypothetical protein